MELRSRCSLTVSRASPLLHPRWGRASKDSGLVAVKLPFPREETDDQQFTFDTYSDDKEYSTSLRVAEGAKIDRTNKT